MKYLAAYVTSAIIREDRNATRKKDRLMFLDELPALGYLGFVSQVLVYGAGYGIRIFAIFQSLSKMKETYPSDWETFLESSLIVFINCKSGAAKYVSGDIGETTINVESESTGTSEQSRQGEASKNTSQQSGVTQSTTRRKLLTESELKSLGTDVIVAFFENCPPIVCPKVNYLKHKYFKGKFDPNPLHTNLEDKKYA